MAGIRNLSRRGFLKTAGGLSIAGIVGAAVMAEDVNRLTEPNAAKDIKRKLPQVNGGNGNILNKAFISFRIGIPLWLNEENFKSLLKVFERYRGVTDELTFFTSETHMPLPLAEIERRSLILSDRIAAAKKLGYKAGINCLATLGHHEENVSNSFTGDFARVTDIEGRVCQGTFCPSDSRYLDEYVRPLYAILAKVDADYIWIDDDVRTFSHAPLGMACFCDSCLKKFEKESGTLYTRASLKAAFNNDNESEKLKIRKAWLGHNSNWVAGVLACVEKSVHETKPGMPLGFMNAPIFWDGEDLDNWAKILAGPKNATVIWRPGGGNYTEERPEGVLLKAHQIGYDVAVLGKEVLCIEAEIESFSYQRLKKSEHYTSLEAATYIASGCTGTAFNVLGMGAANTTTLDEYEPLIKRLYERRPFYNKMVALFGREMPTGIFTCWSKESVSLCKFKTGNWTDSDWTTIIPGLNHADEMFKVGLPVAYRADKAQAVALSGDTPLLFTDKQLREMLSGGVYLDGEALLRLNQMGFKKLTGFEVIEKRDKDTIEELTGHPLNGGSGGVYRDGRQSFWKSTAYSLKPTSTGSQALSKLVDYKYTIVADCSTGVFENDLGGRICVAGYYPWEHLQYKYKTEQLKNIFRWLSKDTLGAYIASYHRISLWDRITEDGRHAIAMINTSLDPARNVELMLKSGSSELCVVDMNCRSVQIKAAVNDGPYKRFILPQIEPWNMLIAYEV